MLDHLPSSIRALAPTQRGHGDAPKPPDGYAPADFAADLEELMDAKQLDAAVLVASSSAAFTVRCFAAGRADRVLGIVCIGSPFSLAGNPAVEAMRAEIDALDDPLDPAFVRDFVAGTAGPGVPAGFLADMVAESLAVPAHVWRLTFAGLVEPGVPEGVRAGPALLIWGEEDAIIGRADQEALAATFTDAELRVYPGTGHIVHWEQPAAVAADIAGFALRFA